MSTIVSELSKIRSEHLVLANTIRTKHAEYSVLEADRSYVDQLNEAHTSLEKSVNAWSVSRKAALDGNVKGAEEAAQEARLLLTEATKKLASIRKESVPADQSSKPSPAASSPEPKPTPPAPKPTPPPSKNDDTTPPAQAGQGKADKRDEKVIDLDDIMLKSKVQAIVNDMVGPSFIAINGQLAQFSNATHLNESINALLASGDYTIGDIERSFKIGRFLNSKFKRHHGKHTNAHDEHHQDQADDHDSSVPPTKAHNLVGADQKATPRNERN